jgi:DNA topoisomerase-1
LAEAKSGGRRGPQLIRELGAHPDGGSVGLYRGRYGPYVSHDGLFASLPKAGNPDNFSLAEALPLLEAQKAKGKTPRRAKATNARGTNGAAARKPARKPKRAAAKAPASRRAPSSRPASR